MKSSRWAPKSDTAVEQPSVTTQSPPQPASQDSPVAPASTSQHPVPAPIEPEHIEAPLPQEFESQTIPTYDPTMDEFAQTREDDDLFDDDVVPLSDPAPIIVDAPVPVAVDPLPVEEKPIPTAPAAHNHNRGRGGVRGRGRGRGNHALPKEPAPAPAESATSGTVEESTSTSEGAPKDAPTTPAPKKEGAVRGDRSGTGGIKKAKLTDAELTARLATISLKNASLTAAHARAEADAASFEAREARAQAENQKKRAAHAARQKEEKVNRNEMLGERERNRQRKMNAAMGREWDAEKEDLAREEERVRGGGNRRGAFGGVVRDVREERRVVQGEGGDGERDVVVEDVNAHAPSGPAFRGRGRGRGRGPRGGRGGASRGDSHTNGSSPKPTESQAPPSASDFPDLPPAAAKEQREGASAPTPLSFPKKPQLEKVLDTEGKKSVGLESPDTPVDGKRSWADQVEREGRND